MEFKDKSNLESLVANAIDKGDLPRYCVIQESFDDPDSLKVSFYPFATSTNSIFLKCGFKTYEEANAWKEEYQKDPSIWTKEDRFNEMLEGLKALNNLIYESNSDFQG